MVYLRDKKRPFAYAGIWNKTNDEATGENVYSFAIIANGSFDLAEIADYITGWDSFLPKSAVFTNDPVRQAIIHFPGRVHHPTFVLEILM